MNRLSKWLNNLEGHTARRWTFVAVASTILGSIFAHVGVPAAWIVAGIIVAGTVAITTKEELVLNRHFFSFCRGFIGVLAGMPLISTPLAGIVHSILPGLFATAVTLAIGVGGGLLLSRTQREISKETGILSMTAGGASIVPLLAKELGADYRYVALSQYLRLLAVSMSLPVITHLFAPDVDAAALASPHERTWWSLVLVLLIAAFGEKFGRAFKIPTPSIFGPLLLMVGVGLALPDADYTPPDPLRFMAFMAIGWMCGGGLSVAALKLFAHQLPATITFILVLISGCAASAWPLTKWLDISYFEAYLATTPGALETVLALADEGGAGPEVVTVQLIRIIFVLLFAGYLPALLRLFGRKD